MSDARCLRYEILDVFAESPLAGNPLAVFHGGAQLETATLQAIAREMNLSETSFVRSPIARDGAFDVRIFTPAKELPYAGHPTLGTAFAIRAALPGGEADSLSLRLGVGVVPVRFAADGLVWLVTPRASFAPAPFAAASVAAALGIASDGLDPHWPIELATTGENQLLVPVRDLAALRRCGIDGAAYRRLRDSGAPASLYAFTRETRDARNHLSVRLFAPDAGVPEDPATGSAAGWLGAYLARHRVLGAGDFEVRLEQGHEIQRPSLLHVRARHAANGAEISVGGRVIRVARGELLT